MKAWAVTHEYLVYEIEVQKEVPREVFSLCQFLCYLDNLCVLLPNTFL